MPSRLILLPTLLRCPCCQSSWPSTFELEPHAFVSCWKQSSEIKLPSGTLIQSQNIIMLHHLGTTQKIFLWICPPSWFQFHPLSQHLIFTGLGTFARISHHGLECQFRSYRRISFQQLFLDHPLNTGLKQFPAVTDKALQCQVFSWQKNVKTLKHWSKSSRELSSCLECNYCFNTLTTISIFPVPVCVKNRLKKPRSQQENQNAALYPIDWGGSKVEGCCPSHYRL